MFLRSELEHNVNSALYKYYYYFVMRIVYVCVMCASCGSPQCIMHDLQCINAGRGCKRRPNGDLRKETAR